MTLALLHFQGVPCLVLLPNATSSLLCCRYENALEKANYASLAMKQEQEQEQAADAEDEDELQVGPLSNSFLSAESQYAERAPAASNGDSRYVHGLACRVHGLCILSCPAST